MAQAQEHSKHREVTEGVLKVFYAVYNELGSGFLESIYQAAMSKALRQAGFQVIEQAPIPVWFRGEVIGEFRADIVVNGVVLLELKAVETLVDGHRNQLLNYLRATEIEVGLLLNFAEVLQIRRVVYENERKKIRKNLR